MTIAYTSIDDVFKDMNLYMYTKKGGVLNLSMFPLLAKNRFIWMVNNWKTLYTNFKNVANGDENLESILSDFNSDVNSYILGSTVNIFNDIQKIRRYSIFLGTISLNSMGLTPSESVSVSNEITRAVQFSIADFKSMLSFNKQYISDYEGSIGLSDQDALNALGLTSSQQTNIATLNDLENIETIIELNKYISSAIYSLRQTADRPPNLTRIANSNINSDVGMQLIDGYSSALAKPFEMSLEHMAQKYMGDKSQWINIAMINKLQPPYVDSVGTKYNLITPGSNNSVIIPDTEKNNLHIGAKVSIGSYKVREEPRIVERIIYNSDSTMVLFLSGDQDLSKLQIQHKAFVRIYAPNTVTDTDFVLIPSFVPAALSSATTPNSDALRRLDANLLNFGVDIAQDPVSGDILIGSNGNFVQAYGIKNIKQTIENIIKTTKNELPFHPSYGLEVEFGARFFGKSNLVQMITNTVIAQIKADRRFQTVSLISVEATNTSIAINISVTIKGIDQAIPLSFVG